MTIDKIDVFAKDGEKNTDGLSVAAGFPRDEKPARQWFNQLFFNTTNKTNEIIDAIAALPFDSNKKLADTFVTLTSQAGTLPSNLRAKNLQLLDVSDFVNFDDADHTAGLLAAVAAAKSQRKGLTCRDTRVLKISSLVDMFNVRYIDFHNDILCTGATAKIVIGGLSNTSAPTSITFQSITNGTNLIVTPPPASPLLDVVGMKGGIITVGHCNYIRLYADATSVNTSSNAYSSYHLQGITTKLELTDSGVGKSWNNENKFYGGRLSVLHIIGVSYLHNHNKFYDSTIEGDLVHIKMVRAADNVMHGVRAEFTRNAIGVEFAENTSQNRILLTWSNTADPRGMYQNPLAVSDLGRANLVVHEATYQYDKYPVVTANSSTVLLANSAASASSNIAVNHEGALTLPTKGILTPSIVGFTAPANRWLILTDYIPVEYGDVFLFDANYVGSTLRVTYYAYDAKFSQLQTDEGHLLQVSLAWNNTNKNYGFSAGVDAAFLKSQPALIDSKTVKYVRIAMYSSVSNYYRDISISLMGKRFHGADRSTQIAQRQKPLVLAGKPTQGFLTKDSLMFDSTANTNRIVTFAQRTQVATALVLGATSVTVSSATGVANGDIYGIVLPSGKTAWGAVADLVGSSFTITAITEDVPAGSMVVFNRWSEPPAP